MSMHSNVTELISHNPFIKHCSLSRASLSITWLNIVWRENMGFYISTASASADNKESPIIQAIVRLATRIAKDKSTTIIPPKPSIEVQFMLPGKFDKANFTGMQMGGYTEENQTLYFECAVPEHIVESNYTDAYLEAVLDDITSNAEDFFSETLVSFDKHSWTNYMKGLMATV